MFNIKVVNDKPKEVNINWKEFTKDTQWEAYFKDQIPKKDVLLKKSLVIVYHNQTADEQLVEHVKCKNGRGFTMADAKCLTTLAKKVELNVTLTKQELELVRNKLPKYWKQLMFYAKSKMEDK